jgi:hypothetical protein
MRVYIPYSNWMTTKISFFGAKFAITLSLSGELVCPQKITEKTEFLNSA